jgi:hypothetical protein
MILQASSSSQTSRPTKATVAISASNYCCLRLPGCLLRLLDNPEYGDSKIHQNFGEHVPD